MEVVGFAVAIGLVLTALGGGTIGGVLDTPVRWFPLAFAGLGLHLALGLWTPPQGWSRGAAVTLLLVSFLALAAFCAANLRLTGMPVVLLGIGLNVVAVALNGAMPVRLPADAPEADRRALERSATHEPEADARMLGVLGQIVPLPGPLDRPVSFGDLVVGVGLVDVLVHAGRRRPRTTRSERASPANRFLARSVTQEVGSRAKKRVGRSSRALPAPAAPAREASALQRERSAATTEAPPGSRGDPSGGDGWARPAEHDLLQGGDDTGVVHAAG